MDHSDVINTLSALAQPTRFEVFRLLVQQEPAGMLAGEIAKELNVPPNTLSTHLAILANAGLVTSIRNGRTITYACDLDRVRALTTYLVKDCCGGHPELCAPIIKDLSPCCQPKTPKKQRK
jgi:DNA-binding transcriptional ArsR family regulator